MTYIIEKRLMSGLPNLALTAVKYVIAHESGNPNNNGPNALENEIAFMNKNKANAFTSHWVGGGGRIVQVAPVNRVQYGCGPKGNPLSYAQVELARTNDKEQFKKDYAAYIWLLRELAKEAGLPIVLDSSGNGIKSHRWVTDTLGGTTHRDPFPYLQTMGITDEQFKLDIKNGLDQQQTDKDDDIMRFTSVTTKAAVRDYIKESVDKNLINMSWLDKFDQGTLTGGDFEGLKILIKQRGG